MQKKLFSLILRTIRQSLGRFLSMTALLFLGAFALVGLRVTGPIIERTVQTFITAQQLADIFIISDLGISEYDKAELENWANQQSFTISFDHFTDTLIDEKETRLFSLPNTISKPTLLSGEYPTANNEILLSQHFMSRYSIGDHITITSTDISPQLTHETFVIAGFTVSSEYISNTALGTSSVGDGVLSGLAYVLPEVFESDLWTVVRLKGTHTYPLYSEDYQQFVWETTQTLHSVLEDNAHIRLNTLHHDIDAQIDIATQQRDHIQNSLAYLPSHSEQYATLQHSLTQLNTSLQQAEHHKNALYMPTYTIYDRSTMLGAEGYDTIRATAKGITSVSYIFPVVLYAVSILVTLTTMTRLVNDERSTAGILKALGYDTKDVMKLILYYGLFSGIIGTLTGSIAGLFFLPTVIGKTLLSDTILPPLSLTWDFYLLILTLLITLACSLLPALWIAIKELRHPASTLLHPKPPAQHTRILLEKVPYLWSKLSFNYKLSLRNIFRYKQRMFMTLFGVAGSVALLFSGLGILSSLSGISTRQYQELLPYDTLLIENQAISTEEKQQINDAILHLDVMHTLPILYKNITYTHHSTQQSFSILTIATDTSLEPLIHLYDPYTHEKLSLQNNGVTITQKLSEILHVKRGDTLTFSIRDKTLTVPITAVTEMYAGHFMFLNKTTYETYFNDTYQANGYLIDYKKEANIPASSQALLNLNGVQTLLHNHTTQQRIDTMVHSLTLVMGILTVVSIILSIVILYNLTTINISERIRELSTIKVLGFYTSEVTLYIYRETAFLSALGIIIGIALGIPLHKLLIDVTATNMMMFHPNISPWVFMTPPVIITLVLLGLGIHVHHYLKNIKMLDALKSVD